MNGPRGGPPIRLGNLADSTLVGNRSIGGIGKSPSPPALILWLRSRTHIVRVSAVSADMLLHIILSRKCLIANRAMHTLLTGVLFAVARSMARGSEGRRAPVTGGVGAWILILSTAAANTGLGRL